MLLLILCFILIAENGSGTTAAEVLKKGLKMKVSSGDHMSNGISSSAVNGAASPTEENNNADKKGKERTRNGLDKTKKNKKNSDEEEGEVEEETGKKEEQEVVFIQDMGFTVKIVSPGIEPFDIQVG